MRALIIVDVQNDFMPGGALAVPRGEEIIPVINDLMQHFDVSVATQDWHPADHVSFAANHEGKKPGDLIKVGHVSQVLWPIHCIAGSYGAQLVSSLHPPDKVFHKGTDKHIDSYSAFFDNGHLKATGLGDYLRQQGIKELFVTGVATDYCVLYSVLDALLLEFDVYVITDGCRGIDLTPGDEKRAFEHMKSKGAHLIRSDQVPVV